MGHFRSGVQYLTECTVGIYTQFDLGWGEMPADVRQYFILVLIVVG